MAITWISTPSTTVAIERYSVMGSRSTRCIHRRPEIVTTLHDTSRTSSVDLHGSAARRSNVRCGSLGATYMSTLNHSFGRPSLPCSSGRWLLMITCASAYGSSSNVLFSHTNHPAGHVKLRPAELTRPRHSGTEASALGLLDPRDVRPASPFAFGEPSAPSAPTPSVAAITIAARRLAGQERRIPEVSSRTGTRAYARSDGLSSFRDPDSCCLGRDRSANVRGSMVRLGSEEGCPGDRCKR